MADKASCNIIMALGMFIGTVACSEASVAGSASFASYGGFGNGVGTAASASFRNAVNSGQLSQNAGSSNYRSYAGVLSSVIVVIDVIITFVDEYPSANDWQDTIGVTPKITVETTGGNTVASIKYRISNSGADEDKFLSWQTDVATENALSNNKVRFQVVLPNAVGQQFAESENNYIQWKVKTSGSVESFSGKYRVRVRTNDEPVVIITQPDRKSGYTGDLPLIQAIVSDRYWGIDENSIDLRIDKASGENILQLNGSGLQGAYNASKSLLSYKYDRSPLEHDTLYRLTVSARDRNGQQGQSSVTFTVKGGAIADVIPYPSPFDPKVQPVTIRYVLNKRSEVTVNLYDIGGRLVQTLVNNQTKEPGISEEQWTGNNYAGDDLANGVYLCEIVAKDEDGEHRRYSSLAIFGK